MIDFEDLFLASRGQPVEYEGQTIQLMDTISLSRFDTVRIVRESSKPGWRRGIHLSTEGHFTIGERVIPNAVVLWADTAPETVSLSINSDNEACYVKNVWDTGDGTVHSWHNGAAMIVDQTEKARRYRCNDGDPDAGFDDLVFRIEIEAAKPR